MNRQITIRKKTSRKGDDGHKIVSVRMKDALIEKLDNISSQTNRSRNDVINILLESAVEIVDVED